MDIVDSWDTGLNEGALIENKALVSDCLDRDIYLSRHSLEYQIREGFSPDMRQYRIKMDEVDLGYVDLQAFPLTKKVSVSDINISPQGQGNGWVIYNELGEYLKKNGLEFTSSQTQNNGALKIWERLHSEGKAELINDDPDPTRRGYKYI